jgi:hypothetical protein
MEGAAVAVTGGRQSRKSSENRVKPGVPIAQHVIDVERRLVTVRFGEKLSFEDIERYTELLHENPAFEPTFSEIADLSEVKQVDLQADDFMKLADQTDPFSPAAKRAFVARSSVQKHAARMHRILRSQRNIEIFESLEEAERWICG